jgi:hypothetical protein
MATPLRTLLPKREGYLYDGTNAEEIIGLLGDPSYAWVDPDLIWTGSMGNTLTIPADTYLLIHGDRIGADAVVVYEPPA